MPPNGPESRSTADSGVSGAMPSAVATTSSRARAARSVETGSPVVAVTAGTPAASRARASGSAWAPDRTTTA